MKVIIAGSREYLNYAAVKLAVAMSGFDVTEIVSGHARGVDSLGERYAHEFNIPLKIFAANWSTGRGAGHARNQQMAAYADCLILIWNGVSHGSASMKKYAEERGLKIHEVVFPAIFMPELKTGFTQNMGDFNGMS
jgi:hypothetical protein